MLLHHGWVCFQAQLPTSLLVRPNSYLPGFCCLYNPALLLHSAAVGGYCCIGCPVHGSLSASSCACMHVILYAICTNVVFDDIIMLLPIHLKLLRLHAMSLHVAA